jgi:hypothetical protein
VTEVQQEDVMLAVGDFEGDTEADLLERIAREYEVDPAALAGLSILAAAADCAGYEEGHWFLLRRSDGALLENDAGHCSCYGFEGQWSPTETSVPALLARKTITHNVPSGDAAKIRAFIVALVS